MHESFFPFVALNKQLCILLQRLLYHIARIVFTPCVNTVLTIFCLSLSVAFSFFLTDNSAGRHPDKEIFRQPLHLTQEQQCTCEHSLFKFKFNRFRFRGVGNFGVECPVRLEVCHTIPYLCH